MILNIDSLPQLKTYKCKKTVMEYLVKECNLPLLSVEGEYYFFTENDLLEECLEKMPWWIGFFSRHW